MSGIDKYYENDQGRQPLGNWQGMKERRNTVVSYFFSSMHPISFNIWCTLMWQLIKIKTNTTLLHIINLHQRSGSCLKSKAWWDNFAQIADNLHQFVVCSRQITKTHVDVDVQQIFWYKPLFFIYIRADSLYMKLSIKGRIRFLWSV